MKKNFEESRKYSGRMRVVMAAMLMALFCMVWPHRAMAASTPSITVKSVSGLSATNAQINATVSNPARTKLTRCGFILYNSKGQQLKNRYDKISYTLKSFNAWYSLNSYYGKLSPNTTYKYKFYVMTSAGKYYYSALKSFTTPKQTTTSSSSYTRKVNAFIKDSKWKNGNTWNAAQKPKLSPTSGSGCNAYARDFIKYVYNKDSLSSGAKKFTGASNIKTGDVLYLTRKEYDKTGECTTKYHWIVVLSRSGNTLYVAEGNANGKVRIGTNYSVSGSKVKDTKWNLSWSLSFGYHY